MPLDAAPELIEGEGTELEPVAPLVPTNLFPAAKRPADVLKEATEVANALAPVLREQNMVVQIQGKDHVTVEGWLTLGAMLGVTAVCEWTHELPNGWEARVLAKTLDGRTIGAAEGECLRDEGRWKTADDYAVRSMAQTRATSKALASVLRFVVTLAGFQGTPAEEMPRERVGAGGGEATPNQKRYLTRLLNEKGIASETAEKLRQAASGGEVVTKAGASKLIDSLKEAESLEALLAEYEVVPISDVPIDMTGVDDPGPEDVPFE